MTFSTDRCNINICHEWSRCDVFDKVETTWPVSYTHLRAHETSLHLVCRLLLEKKRTGYTRFWLLPLILHLSDEKVTFLDTSYISLWMTKTNSKWQQVALEYAWQAASSRTAYMRAASSIQYQQAVQQAVCSSTTSSPTHTYSKHQHHTM